MKGFLLHDGYSLSSPIICFVLFASVLVIVTWNMSSLRVVCHVGCLDKELRDYWSWEAVIIHFSWYEILPKIYEVLKLTSYE